MNEPAHKPVLLNEILELLNPQPGEIGLDCTFGEGGHSAAIAQRLRGLESGHLFAFDRDSTRLAAASSRLLQQGLPVTAIHENFAAGLPRNQRSKYPSGTCSWLILALTPSRSILLSEALVLPKMVHWICDLTPPQALQRLI